MSIVIDADLAYLQTRLHISSLKLQEEYANLSVEDIIEAEAASGNQEAIKLANELLNNVDLVIKLFNLSDANNKYEILSQMTAQELQLFLPQMEEKDLVQGLYYFSEDKLMTMLEDVPPEQLVKVVFEMFSKEEVVQLLPDEQLDKFLTSTEIDKNKILKHMQSIPEEYLIQVLENVTGQTPENQKSYDLVKQIGELGPLEFVDVLKSFQPTQKQQLVLSLGKEHPEWFQLFDANAYTNMIDTHKQKPDMVKSMAVLEQEELVKMTEELPNDLLATVITQMDTEKFAEIMMDRMPEIIAEFLLK